MVHAPNVHFLLSSKLNKFMNPAWGMPGCLAWRCVGRRSLQKAALGTVGRDIRDAAPAPGLGGGGNVDAGGPSLLNNSNIPRVQKNNKSYSHF